MTKADLDRMQKSILDGVSETVKSSVESALESSMAARLAPTQSTLDNLVGRMSSVEVVAKKIPAEISAIKCWKEQRILSLEVFRGKMAKIM